MNGRLKLIEQQLLGIDSAAFQNLCDIYLLMREQQLSSINRTGSQFGKQKTVKGTPDTFFRLSNGDLRYVEFTTKADGLVDKITEDIDKCLDPKKTGVPVHQIQKIIICFNSRLEVADETAITQYAVSKKIAIELIGLDWLALEIYSKYLILAKDILGIPLDTGQLLPISNFIEEYNNKAGKLSTPLDNIFLHRKTELYDIENTLESKDLLIISGFPGVGKTKIAIEAIDAFLSKNNDYSAFAVSKKDQDISEDLKIHLQQEKNYVLLVDDANRQLLNFKQILGVFKEKRKGNIKLVVTVRDYALNDISNECIEYEQDKIVIEKFSDSEITELISSDSFEILNPRFQQKIVSVADGNARLAVMAARIAMQKQEEFLFGDVSELYDSYFQTFIKDFDGFGDKSLIKTLGMISFFFTIDRSNKEFIQLLLKTFELDYHAFNEAIDELEKRELIEVQYNHARVSEQVMATYFFYKVFIKEEILSFKTLLFSFFPSWKKRFKDTIIPSNNSFGYDNVLKKINGSLDEYLQSVYNNEELVLEFFSLFWFYKREETVNYFHQKITQLPEPNNPIYDTKYETNDFLWDRDRTLDFLADLFKHSTESFLPALELGFEYCRKKPESLPEFVRRIRENLLFDENDHNFNFQRQVDLFELIINKVKEKKPHYMATFFTLSGTFLAHHYQVTKGGRNGSISFYDYPLPFYEITKDFRESIWTTLFASFENYPEEVLSAIQKFRPSSREAIPEILDFDLSLLLPFIESNLDTNNFKHCHFVHELISPFDIAKLTNSNYQNLKTKFDTKEYKNTQNLDWNRYRGRRDYSFAKYEDFEAAKEKDIRAIFVFNDENEFETLHNAVKNILSLEEGNNWSVEKSLDIIIEENFLKNNELGFKLLSDILESYPTELNPLTTVVKLISSKSPEWAMKLWNEINNCKNKHKLYWQLTFFVLLPDEFANSFYKARLLETIRSIDKGCYLRFENFEKFISIKSDTNTGFLSKLPIVGRFFVKKDRNIIEEILSIAYYKIETHNLRIQLPYGFFERYTPMLADNFELLKKSYLQQEKTNDHFDYERKGLLALLQIEPDFLLEYIKVFYTIQENQFNHNTYNQLSFLWDLEDKDELIKKVMILVTDNNFYLGFGDHPLIVFFRNLTEQQTVKAKQFLLNFISEFHTDEKKMNPIFDVMRHCLQEFFEVALLHYLSFNSNIDTFKKISWNGNGGTYSGEVIIGEIRAAEWQKILEIVTKSPNQLDLIPIKTYTKKRIEYELKSAEAERKRKFINPERW